MKKLIPLIIAIFMASVAAAQPGKVSSALGYLSDPAGTKLGEAKTKIDEAATFAEGELENLKKELATAEAMPEGKEKDKAVKKVKKQFVKLGKTWYVRGMVYQGIGESILPDMKKLDEDALNKSYTSYLKALELGEHAPKKYADKEDIIAHLKKLSTSFAEEAGNQYRGNDYKKSMEAFIKCVEISQNPLVNTLDTSNVYNTALTADLSKNHKIAAEYYLKAANLEYGKNLPTVENGDTLRDASGKIKTNSDLTAKCYIFAANNLKALGDSVQAIDAIQTGFKAFPNFQPLTVELTNYYINRGENDKALEFIDKAIQQDASNHTFHFAKGTLLEGLGKKEEAIASYQNALNIKPTDLNTNFNLGALYYNNGVEFGKEANDLPLGKDAEYAKLQESMKVEYQKAVPFLEKALESSPEEVAVLQSLKTIYTKLQMYDKQKEIKAKLDTLK